MRSISAAGGVVVCVLFLATTNVFAQGTRNCASTVPYPKLPVQTTIALSPQKSLTSNRPTKEKTTTLNELTQPRDRFLVITNISMKGTHPPGTYLAIELGTTLNVQYPAPAPVLNRASSGPARHFLYSKWQAESSALHLREEVEIFAAPGSTVSIGVQTTTGSAVEEMELTITGWSVDACQWGKL